MGTRNLTMVIENAKPVVAQYGQWDGYPEGQGATILEFLKKTDIEQFKQKLKKARLQTEEDKKAVNDFLKSIGCEDGWMNDEQSKKFNAKFPYLSRNHGGEILEMINDAPDDADIMLSDTTAFAGDPGFCEWAYVVNLDTNQLEVYGWDNPKAKFENTFEKLFKKEPYATQLKEDKDYEGAVVGTVMAFNLDKLPTEKQFIKKCSYPED